MEALEILNGKNTEMKCTIVEQYHSYVQVRAKNKKEFELKKQNSLKMEAEKMKMAKAESSQFWEFVVFCGKYITIPEI